MPVNTQPNVSLVVSLDGVDYACQVIDATWTPPSVGDSTVTETACPEGVVGEPGSISSGSLTGTAFTDSTDAGITWVLAQAQRTDTQIDYSYTEFPELGPTHAMQWSGLARVKSYSSDFAKPGLGKTKIDLEILTTALARPAA